MLLTRGYVPELLGEHFDDHKGDFGVQTEQEYEALADAFMGGPVTTDMRECTRASNGDVIRFNLVTNEFGIMSSNRRIRTYYKPNPRRHRMVSNWAYFSAECRK